MKIRVGTFVLFLLCLTSLLASDVNLDEMVRTLAKPQVIVLTNGQVIEGYARGIEDNRLVFIRPTSGGKAEYTFAPEEVERIDFPGMAYQLAVTKHLANGEPQEALTILEALYQQRAPYLTYMPADEVAYFIKLVDLARAQGDPYLSVGVAKYLHTLAKDNATATHLADLILLGHYQLPLKQETAQLAEAWLDENDIYGPSALGWYILARMAYDEGNYTTTRDLALKPIVFSSQYPMAYLEHCYAVAILAALELEDEAHALALAQEMSRRRLAWPRDEGLADSRSIYESLLRHEADEDGVDLSE